MFELWYDGSTPTQPQTLRSCFHLSDDSKSFFVGDNKTPTPSPTANGFGSCPRLNPKRQGALGESTPPHTQNTLTSASNSTPQRP